MPRVGLLAILAVALVLRAGLVLATTEYVPSYDARDYDLHALYIEKLGRYPPSAYAAPGSPSAFRPPAYPHALAAVYKLTGKRWTAGRLFGALLGVASVLLLYLIAELVFGRRTALAAGWIAAAFPPFVFMPAALLAENLFVPLVLGATWAALAYRRSPRWWWLVAAGVFCGAAALTRTNGILVLLVAAVAVLLAQPRPRLRLRALAAPAAVCAVAVLAIAPWTIRNARAFHAFVPISTQTGWTLIGAYNADAAADGPLQAATRVPTTLPELRGLFHRPGLDEVELDRKLRKRARSFAADHPGYLPEAFRLNTMRMFGLGGDPRFTDIWNQERDITSARKALSGVGLAIVCALALVALVRGRIRGAPVWLWAIPLLLFLSTAPILGNPRYRASIDPFLVLLAAAAIQGAGRFGRSEKGWSPTPGTA